MLRSAPQAPAEATAAWLPTPGDRGLMFTLRVYHPSPALQAAPQALAAPTIESDGNC